MTIGVVIPILSAGNFISHQQHWDALTDHEDGDRVSHLSPAQPQDFWIGGFAFDSAVPALVIVSAVAVVFVVAFVVLFVIGKQISQRKAIMGSDEVDRAINRASGFGIEIGRAL